jgi:hypothetical protein
VQKSDIINAVYQHYNILLITLIPSVSPTHFRHAGVLAEKLLLDLSCLCVCLHINLAPIGQFFTKFDIKVFY